MAGRELVWDAVSSHFVSPCWCWTTSCSFFLFFLLHRSRRSVAVWLLWVWIIRESESSVCWHFQGNNVWIHKTDTSGEKTADMINRWWGIIRKKTKLGDLCVNVQEILTFFREYIEILSHTNTPDTSRDYSITPQLFCAFWYFQQSPQHWNSSTPGC